MVRYLLRRPQQGQTIVLFALSAVVLFGMAAIALDTGLAMADRRNLQAAVDSASLAGAREYYTKGGTATSSNAHYVAMMYLASAVNETVSASCTYTSCGAIVTMTGGYSFTFVDGAGTLDITAVHTLPALFAAAGNLGSTGITVGTGARAKAPGAVSATPADYAVFAAGGSFSVNGGGTSNPSGDVSGNVYAAGSIGGNNGPHAIRIPTEPTDANGNVCLPATTTHLDTTDSSVGGSFTWIQPTGGPASGTTNTNVSPAKPDPYAAVPAPVPSTNPTYTTSAQALANNLWQPGTYSGFFPDKTHLMAAGVYVVKNVTGNMQVGGNSVPGTAGAVDKTGAVSIVLDASDTGSLDLSSAIINGLDDDGSGVRDALGTHNTVIWGQNYTGSTSFGSGSSGPARITGIVDLPKSAASSNGTPEFHYYGSVAFKSFDLKGGGGGTQTFDFVCGLQAVVAPTSGSNGLQR